MCTYRCDLFNLNNQPRRNDTAIDSTVTTTKKMGMIHNSLSLAIRGRPVASELCEEYRFQLDAPGDRKKATFENKSDGVNRETLSRLICYMIGMAMRWGASGIKSELLKAKSL
jgi:hypothetical protein